MNCQLNSQELLDALPVVFTAPAAEALDRLRSDAAAAADKCAVALLHPLGNLTHKVLPLELVVHPARHHKGAVVRIAPKGSCPAPAANGPEAGVREGQLGVMDHDRLHVLKAPATRELAGHLLHEGPIAEARTLLLAGLLVEDSQAHSHWDPSAGSRSHCKLSMAGPLPDHLHEDGIHASLLHQLGLLVVASALHLWGWPLAHVHLSAMGHAWRVAAHA
eukprot:CAMPEP_0115052726 /NCGR_PEP_ID=MMETSP0227-20121206/3105_1 /TAXON_ID=89957 /ORGANISM="Polarella glacialis, Strain CCMP 1383" /LENGTH=218 /DNA_ID=CAMNT_0002436935 /DNA_START=110 /DNA_END=763 /DNA_ORIENTATION=+